MLEIAGRNHLRAMRAIEDVAAGLQRTEAPHCLTESLTTHPLTDFFVAQPQGPGSR